MIYFDNASTTKINPEVIDVITKSMGKIYGNPSSTHSLGRKAKVAVETARNSIAKIMGCKPKEIIFTSGGTEADNAIIFNAVNTLKVQRIISSPIEHHAVLDTIRKIEEEKQTEVSWLKVDEYGNIDIDELEELLKENKTTFVSLIHVNNEIGNLLDLEKVGSLCKKYNAAFHSDTVQGIAHLDYKLSETPVDFVCASAHKFGGPKGIGFIYKSDGAKFAKQMLGGEQERDFRAGTENIHGIVGMQKALELVNSSKQETEKHIKKLKSHLITELKNNIDGIVFNGLSDDLEKSISAIVNIKLPLEKANKMLVFQFDLKGISISEGSACSSGNNLASHVLKELYPNTNIGSNIRISFSKDNTLNEVDTFISVLKEFLSK
jgi:cysteine desulfurase